MSTLLHFAKVTIELTTPLHIGSGKSADGADAGLVLDANGLPTIPGSGIRGVLRSVCETQGRDADAWFGFGAEKADPVLENGRQSYLTTTWALIHNSSNGPIDGLVTPQEILADDVLRNAASPAIRDHVRLNHCRAAEKHGKFDELAVSPGHRFTFELKLITSHENDDQSRWEELLNLLGDPLLRFGGKTLRGFGEFKVIGMDRVSYDLSNPDDQLTYLDRPVRIDIAAKTPWGTSPTVTTLGVNLSCDLAAESLWMIGGGADDDADLAPVMATRVKWGNDTGKVEDCFLIPGTSVKGALAHRTCFHANLLAKVFADKIPADDFETVTGSNNGVVKILFGHAVDHGEETGSRGNVFIDDVYLPVADGSNDPPTPMPPQNHVSLDPFTGGAKSMALFQDRPLAGGRIKVPIYLRGGWDAYQIQKIYIDKDKPEDEHLACPQKSFKAALKDLEQGSLAIGAHSSRGYGYFKTTQTP